MFKDFKSKRIEYLNENVPLCQRRTTSISKISIIAGVVIIIVFFIVYMFFI